MSFPVATIIEWLDLTLDPTRIDDYGPNGLQVEASEHVRRVVTGVTANLAFIDAAIAARADLAVVHHGLYWNGARATATGALGRRLARLFGAGVSLAAYHLPLDGHPELGNATELARTIGLTQIAPAFTARGIATGCVGTWAPAASPAHAEALLAAHVSARLLFFHGGPPAITQVGIVTGGAPRLAEDARRLGCDLFVTGEAGEYSQATAREDGIHIAACGHHRTETFGPRALAVRLRAAFPGLDAQFLDVDNPA